MQGSFSTSFILFLAMSLAIFTTSSASILKGNFYGKTCPSAESIVRRVVNNAITTNPGLGAGVIRMHFHDCFVRGCDASILLDSTPGNPAEKENIANNPSLRGYEVIDEAKAELESQCPGTVSCADIIAFAARDSASILGGINYEVAAGRRDGSISRQHDPDHNLPAPFFSLEQLKQNFTNKGLSLAEMVTLSGAHSIGLSHCSSFSNRLNPQDPLMNPSLANQLKVTCPTNGASNSDATVNIDNVTPNKLDNMFYKNLQNGNVLFTSDQALMTSRATISAARKFGNDGDLWARKFAKAMVRMGSIEVLTGAQGEIRRNCRVVNSN